MCIETNGGEAGQRLLRGEGGTGRGGGVVEAHAIVGQRREGLGFLLGRAKPIIAGHEIVENHKSRFPFWQSCFGKGRSVSRWCTHHPRVWSGSALE